MKIQLIIITLLMFSFSCCFSNNPEIEQSYLNSELIEDARKLEIPLGKMVVYIDGELYLESFLSVDNVYFIRPIEDYLVCQLMIRGDDGDKEVLFGFKVFFEFFPLKFALVKDEYLRVNEGGKNIDVVSNFDIGYFIDESHITGEIMGDLYSLEKSIKILFKSEFQSLIVPEYSNWFSF